MRLVRERPVHEWASREKRTDRWSNDERDVRTRRETAALATASKVSAMARPPAASWSGKFTADEERQLLEDDRLAMTAISIILVCIFLLGLLLTLGAIGLS